jgi:hypothetical protein
MIAKKPKSIVTKPSAWIVSPKDKGRKSIKNGKVYLNDKDEFEIELYNPMQDCVLADIKLNGKSISSSGLILKPGQRFYLDCFIDDRKKFIFNTYEVEDSDESLEAIQKNGLLEVFFYKESVVTLNNWKSNFDRIIVERWYPYGYVGYPGIYYSTSGLNSYSTSTGYNISSTNTGYNISGTLTNCSSNTVSLNNNLFSSNLNCKNINNVETGRIEKGSESSQKFVEVDMDFEKNYISSTILQILPESRKPIDTKDLSKINDELTVSSNLLNLLKQLDELREAGILTEEEFKNKKTEILSKI